MRDEDKCKACVGAEDGLKVFSDHIDSDWYKDFLNRVEQGRKQSCTCKRTNPKED